MPDVIVALPETVTVAIVPGTTVTTLFPETEELETEVAVIVTVPDKTPVSLSTLSVAEPVPLPSVQVKVSVTLLPAASLDTAVYETVCIPDVIGVVPETVTLATAPGTIVTTLVPDMVGLEIDVALIVTVPDNTPVSLSTLRVAEPVPLPSVQV